MNPRVFAPLSAVWLCLPPSAAALEIRNEAVAPAPTAVRADPVAAPILLQALPGLAATPELAAPAAQNAPEAPKTAVPARPQAIAAQTQAAAVYDGTVSGTPPGAEPPELSPAQWVQQGAARAKLLALRAATLPAHAWPVRTIANKLAHGEALAGLSPREAAKAAADIRAESGAATVIGRLSWELHDIWSVRGAVRSYSRLIDEIAKKKSRDPGLDASVSLDIEALGAQLDGVSAQDRARIVQANALHLARRARAAGVPIEFDAGASAVMPTLLDAASAVARSLGIPVRLAIPARFTESQALLAGWAALASETGLRLGVRLVKGSFIESDVPGAVNQRHPLLQAYKRLISRALESGSLDVAVATQNEEIWEHARAESLRLGVPVTFHVIRGVNAPLQARMRAEGGIAREYVSYGLDTPVMGLMEAWTNWRHRRALERRGVKDVD